MCNDIILHLYQETHARWSLASPFRASLYNNPSPMDPRKGEVKGGRDRAHRASEIAA